jgi:hypothetical protein
MTLTWVEERLFDLVSDFWVLTRGETGVFASTRDLRLLDGPGWGISGVEAAADGSELVSVTTTSAIDRS